LKPGIFVFCVLQPTILSRNKALVAASATVSKTYPIDLLTALKELATNNNDNAIFAAIIENETAVSQLERVEQLQGLGIFAADIREELIHKTLKPLLELEELAVNSGADKSLPRYCRRADNLRRLKSFPLSEVNTRFVQSVRWKGDSVITKRK
jgi:hypothetical protein